MNTKNLLITGMFAGLFLSCKEVEPPAPVLPGSDAGADQMAENGELCIRAFRVEHIQ